MSKANSPIKVLRTALKRVEKGWSKSAWHERYDGQSYVCLEGAIYGFCNARGHETPAQKKAIEVVEQIILERLKDGKLNISEFRVKRLLGQYGVSGKTDGFIPAFNDDSETVKEDILEIIKLAIIRLETGGDEDEVIEFDPDEDLADLLPPKAGPNAGKVAV